MALVAAIGYMMGGVFGPRITTWCKGVLVNCVKSVIILTLVSALFLGLENLGSERDSFVGAGFFQIDNAINFAETVRNTIIYEFMTMTAITAIMSMLGNITPYLRPAGIIGISFSLAPAFRPIFDTLGMMLSSLAIAIGTWFVQLWLLVYIKTRLMAVLMPLGIFLRSFGYARPGNVLIAIAIGFYFVFPFVLNINAIALENYLVGTFEGSEAVYQDSMGGEYGDYHSCVDHTEAGGQSLHCFYRLSLVAALEHLTDMITSVGVGGLVVFAMMNFFTGSLVGSAVFGFLIIYTLSLLSTTLFYVVVVSVLVPLFNIFITLTVIKEIAKYLGTEIDLSAFEKIF